MPAVEQLLSEGLELPAGLTVLVGENGSGKFTVMEMLARACGLNPQGGSAAGQLFRVRDSEPEAGAQLIVERGPVRPRWSYFLRADTMHSLYTYLEENPGARRERFHELSHGEGFLQILRTRVNQAGFYLMDEPDAPLSFTACLGLAACFTTWPPKGRRPWSRPTRRSWPPFPARSSGSWVTGVSAPPGGRTCTSSGPGRVSWPTPACTSGI